MINESAGDPELVVVYDIPNGYRREAETMFRRLRIAQFTPQWVFDKPGEHQIAIPSREVPQLRLLQKHQPATYGTAK